MLVKGIHHQRAFARAGDPGHAGQHAQRDAAVDIAQVVGGYAVHDQRSLPFAPLVRQGDNVVAAQVAGRKRVSLAQQIVHPPLKHDFAALRAGAWAKLDDRIRSADGGLVVLHHKHGVAARLQRAQRAQQPFVVAGMQADGRLVEHIGNPHKAGAELRSQADALRLAARESGHGAPERKVFKPHAAHERQAVGQLLHQRFGYDHMPPRKFALAQPLKGTLHREVAKLRDIQVVHPHGESVGVQPRAVAVGAVHGLAKTRQRLAPGVAILHAAFKQGDNAGPALFTHAHLPLRP